MVGSGGEAPNRLLSLVGLFQIGTDAAERRAAARSCSRLLNIFVGVINLSRCCPSTAATSPIAIYEQDPGAPHAQQGRYFADVAKLLPLTYAVVLVLVLLVISSIYLDIAIADHGVIP